MGNLRDENKLRPIRPTDVVLGADEDGCLFNIPPDNFSGSIPISIDTETGDGEELFTEPNVNDFIFKKIKSSDNSADVTTDTDGNIDLSVNFPEIKSDTFVITSDEDGSVNINSAGGGSNSSDWYLDVNFTRPTNWNTEQNPKEIIDGIPVPNGSLNDPFKTFDEFLLKAIGETGGSNANGVYSRVNPKVSGKTLQILSDLTTDKILEINDWTYELKDNVTVTYTGAENYAINIERLWNAMPKTAGVLNRGIYFELAGEGRVVNKYHAGVVNHKTSVASTTLTKKCILHITAKGAGLNFIEVPDSSVYTPLTLGDNSTPFTHGGVQVMGSTQTPTTPIIKISGKNNTDWGAIVSGAKLTVITMTQSFIEVDNGSVTFSNEDFVYFYDRSYIGYEKKLYSGLAGITADESEIITEGDLLFKPYSDRNIFTSNNGSELRFLSISTLSDSSANIAVNSIFKTTGSSVIRCEREFSELGGGNAVSFIESIGDGNIIVINNSQQTSYVNYFAKGSGSNTVNVNFINSRCNPVYFIKKNIGTLTINTSGTFSYIKNTAINSSIVSYADNATAVAAGLITGMLYFNTTVNGISQVI